MKFIGCFFSGLDRFHTLAGKRMVELITQVPSAGKLCHRITRSRQYTSIHQWCQKSEICMFGTLKIKAIFSLQPFEARLLGCWIIGNRTKRESGQRHTTAPNGKCLLTYLLLQRTVLRTSLQYLQVWNLRCFSWSRSGLPVWTSCSLQQS